MNFALKKWRSKMNYCRNQLGKMEKMKTITMLEKLCLVNFFKFHKKKLSSTQILASEKPPEKYTFSDAMVSISLKIL